MKRALFLALLASFAPLATACTDLPSGFVVDDMRTTRLPDGHVQVDLDVHAFAQGGENAGNYCASIHFFPPYINPVFTNGGRNYFGELDFVEACDHDLADGDTRSFRFVSNHTDLTAGWNLRGQVGVPQHYNWKDQPVP